MQLEKEVIPYLKDEKFSNGLYLKTARAKKTLDNRIDYLCNYSVGKKKSFTSDVLIISRLLNRKFLKISGCIKELMK